MEGHKNHTLEPGSREEWERIRDPFAEGGLKGIGASEAAAALGKNPYRDPLSLWQEKTGLKEPFRGNEATERGTQSEDATRAWFAMNAKDYARVEYHGTRYYISDDLPLFATLDGEIVVEKAKVLGCLDGKTGRCIGMHLDRGMRGVLEIKDTMPRTKESYVSWNTVPEMYRYQVAAQLRVTGFGFAILVAHITGEYAVHGEEYRAFGLFPDDLKEETREIEEGIPVFWNSVITRTQPALVIADEESLTLTEIQPDIRIGTIWADLDTARDSVVRYASRFEGLTFGEHEIKEAKKVRAELNRYKKALNDMRIAVGKQWDAPLAEFKRRVDELIGIVDGVASPIDAQIKDAEEALDKAKAERIEGLKKAVLEALEDSSVRDAIAAMGGVKDNPKWLNAAFTMAAIEKEINDGIERTKSDLASLSAVSDDTEMHTSLLQEYYRTGNINEAISAKERILAARKSAAEAEERKRFIEETRKRYEAMEAEHAAEKEAERKEKKVYSIAIRFSHTDKDAFKALLSYLKSNGFGYEVIKG